jgi:hypothetical protein
MPSAAAAAPETTVRPHERNCTAALELLVAQPICAFVFAEFGGSFGSFHSPSLGLVLASLLAALVAACRA